MVATTTSWDFAALDVCDARLQQRRRCLFVVGDGVAVDDVVGDGVVNLVVVSYLAFSVFHNIFSLFSSFFVFFYFYYNYYYYYYYYLLLRQPLLRSFLPTFNHI